MDFLNELNGYYFESHKANCIHLSNTAMDAITTACRKAAKENRTEVSYHCEGEFNNQEIIAMLHLQLKKLGLDTKEARFCDRDDDYTTITVSGWGR